MQKTDHGVSGAVSPSTRLQSHARKRRSGDALLDGMPSDIREAFQIPLLPVRARLLDLLMRPADEVPPHDDVLAEGFAAEEDRVGAGLGGECQVAAAGAEVEERAGGGGGVGGGE